VKCCTIKGRPPSKAGGYIHGHSSRPTAHEHQAKQLERARLSMYVDCALEVIVLEFRIHLKDRAIRFFSLRLMVSGPL
jgi:hypothetical protein